VLFVAVVVIIHSVVQLFSCFFWSSIPFFAPSSEDKQEQAKMADKMVTATIKISSSSLTLPNLQAVAILHSLFHPASEKRKKK